MTKILTIDPSGEKGTNGACLVDTETKQETKPEKIVYETTNFIDPENTDRIRMTSLFKVIGVIETFQHYFDFIKSIESVYVRSVKMIKERIYKQELYTSGISYEAGRGKANSFLTPLSTPFILLIADLGILGGNSISEAMFSFQLSFLKETLIILGVPFKGL
ncbi:8386_t:CDS:2, partial [Funneliformis geosporum]